MKSASTVNFLSPDFLKSRGVAVNQGLTDWLNRTNFIAKTRQTEEERQRYTHWVLCVIEDAVESSGGIAGRDWTKQPPTMAATATVRVPRLLTTALGPPIGAGGIPAVMTQQQGQRPVVAPPAATAPPAVRANAHANGSPPPPPPFAASAASPALLRARVVEECAQRCPAELRVHLSRAFEVMDASLNAQHRTYEHVGFLQVLQLADSLRRQQPPQQPHQVQPRTLQPQQQPHQHAVPAYPGAPSGTSTSPTSGTAPPLANLSSYCSSPSHISPTIPSAPSGSSNNNHRGYSSAVPPPGANTAAPPNASSAGSHYHQQHTRYADAYAHLNPYPHPPTLPPRGGPAVQQQPFAPLLSESVDDIARSKRPRETTHHHPTKGEALLIDYVSNSTNVLETRRLFRKMADASENGKDSKKATTLSSSHNAVVGSSTSLERKYTRDEPQPCDLRPLAMLEDAFRFVSNKAQVAGKKYLVDQLKGMRQDLSVQGIQNAFTVHVYETAARLCLEVEDLGDFNQCQAALRHLHRLTHASQANVEEFVRYRLAYLAFGGQSDALALELSNVASECEGAVCDTLPLCVAVQDFDALCVVQELQRTAANAPCLTMLARLFLQRQRMLWLHELCAAAKGSIGSVLLLKCLGFMPDLDRLDVSQGRRNGSEDSPLLMLNDVCFVIDGSLERVVASVDQLLELLKFPKPETLDVKADISAYVEGAMQAASASAATANASEEDSQQPLPQSKQGGKAAVKKGGKKKATVVAVSKAAPQPQTLMKLRPPSATVVSSSAMFASSNLLAAVQAYLAFLRTRRDAQASPDE